MLQSQCKLPYQETVAIVTNASFVLAFTFLSLLADSAFGWHTYPEGRKTPKSDPLALSMGGQIPENPENYTWKLVIPKSPQPSSRIPVYQKTAFSGPSLIGTIPAGANVKLVSLTRKGGTNLFKIETPGGFNYRKSKNTPKDLPSHVWVSGRFIKATGKKE